MTDIAITSITADHLRRAADDAIGWSGAQIRDYLLDVAAAWTVSSPSSPESEDEIAAIIRRAKAAEQRAAQADAELAAVLADVDNDSVLTLAEARSEAAQIIERAGEQAEERLTQLAAREAVLRRTSSDLERAITRQRSAALDALTTARAVLLSDMPEP